MTLLALLFAALALCSLLFYVLCLLAVRDFNRQRNGDQDSSPPVSILKPLKGCDPQMYESLRSHCLLDYPVFELIFGVNDISDEAVPLVHRLQAEFPGVSIRLVISAGLLGNNRKVSNLVQMAEHAQHPHLLINDGDIRVPLDYLRRVMAHFVKASDDKNEKTTGMVTCLYRGVPTNTIWSMLEALGICADFMPGVLAARYISGVDFALGSTLAISREALDVIGGLPPLVDYLADDYELGNRTFQAGYAVVISNVVVETFLPEYRFQDFLNHQLRWGRTVRFSRPSGYFGMVFTFGLLWSLLCVGVSGASRPSLMLLAGVLVLRASMVIATARALLSDDQTFAHLWLLPLRDLISPMIWLVSFFGNRIVWRGETYFVEHGKLRP